MQFNDIDSAIEFVTGLKNTGHSFSDFKKICNELGNPQNKFKTIHVAGTNGKGSTVSYLKDLLISHGFKVGTYTSPHYITHLDRIRINNNNIDEKSFIKYLNKYYELYKDVNLSMFEYDYLIMCDYFIDNNIDYAIIEVGLGGKLDATNVVDNTLLSIITTIGYDHMERLGDTLEKICFEKCGIIKHNSNVVIGHLDNNCVQVVKDKCAIENSNLYELKQIQTLEDRTFIFEDNKYKILSYAKYQYHNACLALYAFKTLCHLNNIEFDYKLAYNALKNSDWKARFEIVSENPRIILDGAHNIHGVEALVKSFDMFDGKKCIIFSALKRKEYNKMIDVLSKHCDKLIITTFKNNEVIDLSDFKNYLCVDDYSKAIDYAKDRFDTILVCGSLYFMSEVVLHYNFK